MAVDILYSVSQACMLACMSRRLTADVPGYLLWLLAPQSISCIGCIVVKCRQIADSRISAILAIMVRSFSTLMMVFVGFKIWTTVEWSWTEATWPIWIVMAIMLGVSFITLSLTVSRFYAAIRRQANACNDLFAASFVSVSSVSLLIMTAAVYRSTMASIDDGKVNDGLSVCMWICSIMSSVSIVCVIVYGPRMW